jgi:hypothetical protein
MAEAMFRHALAGRADIEVGSAGLAASSVMKPGALRVTSGTVRPSRASRAAAKSVWLCAKPATITTPPSTNMSTMSGMSSFS